jgi:hypothetical protein
MRPDRATERGGRGRGFDFVGRGRAIKARRGERFEGGTTRTNESGDAGDEMGAAIAPKEFRVVSTTGGG